MAIYHSQTGKHGILKEVFFFAKPFFTFREEMGWVELVENGVNIPSGSDKRRIHTIFEESPKFSIKF